jgi:hypothetical protein
MRCICIVYIMLLKVCFCVCIYAFLLICNQCIDCSVHISFYFYFSCSRCHIVLYVCMYVCCTVCPSISGNWTLMLYRCLFELFVQPVDGDSPIEITRHSIVAWRNYDESVWQAVEYSEACGWAIEIEWVCVGGKILEYKCRDVSFVIFQEQRWLVLLVVQLRCVAGRQMCVGYDVFDRLQDSEESR